MVPLPIVDRELRVISRKRGTYILRCISLLLAGLVCVWFLLSNQMNWKLSGAELFEKIAWVLFWTALSAGVFTTADCLSSEKRQGTLGLLFLTNLRGHEVVLGKLAATSLTTIYGLAAALPVLAVPILLGGVTYGDVALVAIALGITLFISLSVGLLVSALSTSEFEAILGTVLALVGVCVIPRFLVTLLEMAFGWRSAALWGIRDIIGAINPFVLMQIALGDKAGLDITMVAAILLLALAMAVGILLVSGAVVRRSFRDGFGDLTEPLRKLLAGVFNIFRSQPSAPMPRRSVSEVFEAYRRELLDMNPMLWLVNREPLRVKYLWFILGVFLVLWVVGFISSPHLWLDVETTAFFAMCLNGSLKLLLAIEAPRQVAEDRRSGSLELILSTPISDHEVLSGYTRALRQQFAIPIMVVFWLELVLMAMGSVMEAKVSPSACAFTFAAIILLLSDAWTLTVVGIWNGLRSQIPSRAAWLGIFWVMVLPWLVAFPARLWLTSNVNVPYYYGPMVYYGTHRRFPWVNEADLWIFWLMLVLGYNFFLLRRARKRLDGSLRKLAAELPANVN